ncbi:MAG: bifunctional DNA primase/polymerase, partial [Gammaproteobacteria bacterium]
MISSHEAALAYLARGWAVVAIVPGEKRPMVGWQRYQQQLPAEQEVDAWFGAQPDANVGIVTGAVSGLLVLDVDPRHGGEESLQRLQAEHGALPPTPEVITGGGGRHLYFAHPGGSVRNRVALMPGIDVRGDGGLVVAPP